ncbi:nucleoplasmin-like isoform X1 [Heliangelus exortis]|uniref:nucleoplasmin-like isoform X1 n=1 Tax=Heliangelus exortis TaxID=472823 RepID=UPI003A8E3F3A
MSRSSSFSLLKERPVVSLWGCQLDAGTRSCLVKEEEDFLEHLILLKTVRFPEEPAGELSSALAEGTDFFPELLALGSVLALQVCLGAEAQDEPHLVAVDPKNIHGDHVPVPIAVLRTSVLPMISLKDLELVPPVTFLLQCGDGPVYLSGHHITWENDDKFEADEEEVSEEDESHEDNDGAS